MSGSSILKCKICSIRLNKKQKKSYFQLSSDLSLNYAQAFKSEIVLNLGDFICNNCYMSGKRRFMKNINNYFQTTHTGSLITSHKELEPSDCVTTLNNDEADTGENSFQPEKEPINYANLKPENSPEKLDCKEFKEGNF